MIHRDELPGIAVRFGGMVAATWGVTQEPTGYNHATPGFVTLMALTVIGYVSWLAARFVPSRRSALLLGGTLLCGFGGVWMNSIEHGSPAVAFTAVAAGVAFELPQRVAVTLAVSFAATTGLGLVAVGESGVGAAYALIIFVSAAIGNGRHQQIERANQAMALLEQSERNATLLERGRLAREIHDVLAHSLGALAIQLEVADALLTESRDVDAALPRVRQARKLAVEGLVEARSAVAALRTDAPPLPEALQALGSPVTISGTPRPLSPEISLALLRVATESLTNVRKHAAGATVSVTLTYGDGVSVEVVSIGGGVSSLSALPASGASPASAGGGAAGSAASSGGSVVSGTRVPSGGAISGSVASYIGDAGSGGAASSGGAVSRSVASSGGGAGIAGMRERIQLLGGTFSAGPVDGGWRVCATVTP